MRFLYYTFATVIGLAVFASDGLAKPPRAFVMPEPMATGGGAQDRVVQVRADEPLDAPMPDGAPEMIDPGQGYAASTGGYMTDCTSCYGGCDSRCSCCCRACAPAITLRAGTMILNREHSQDVPSLGTGYGYEIDAIRHGVGGSCTDIEARYFGVYGYNSQVAFFFPVTECLSPMRARPRAPVRAPLRSSDFNGCTVCNGMKGISSPDGESGRFQSHICIECAGCARSKTGAVEDRIETEVNGDSSDA
jgi:hypothetical protein